MEKKDDKDDKEYEYGMLDFIIDALWIQIFIGLVIFLLFFFVM